ncbi:MULTISPECIES: formylglycine-generating enzyme family protein [Spirulina sp. CCY15215]|uniref:formylglycine-generating enzyme family protein n=1 Tax=Spirulina sp. CCY15215 TaxID=2767591 RepID=UPI0019518A2E|nr:formylglycine-generating enzyme family protein [Spirulina major]
MLKTKTKKILLACVLGGLAAILLLHQGLTLLKKTQLVPAQRLWSQETEIVANTGANSQCSQDMVWVKGGTFQMGSEKHYKEEKGVSKVKVTGFCIDQYEITNAQFAQFVKETGYITLAERPLSAEEFPNLSEEQRSPGSIVFIPPQGKQQVRELSWWHWVPGADWQHPTGPNSNIAEKDNYPVVQVAYKDAIAYAKWAGKSLPTEAQWEFAAQGGLEGKEFTWGNTYSAKKANTWQGIFPYQNTEEDGYLSSAPIGSFAPNNYDLYDMAGNVWEWTQDWYRMGHQNKTSDVDPIVSNPEDSFDPREPGAAKHVIKGGSYLCAPNYCSRYRPAAREAQAPDTGTSHIGFRLVTKPTNS